MGEIEQYYEDRLRHLETPEFVAWFENWYAKPEEYGQVLLRDEYFNERRFALIGWIAAKTPGAHLMTRIEFSAEAIPSLRD